MIRLDFVEDGSPDCPIVRFSGSDAIDFDSFRRALVELSDRQSDCVLIHELPGIAAAEDVRLVARVGDRDRGVMRNKSGALDWILTAESWDNAAGLLEPFCGQGGTGNHQWLQASGDARVLVTRSGTW